MTSFQNSKARFSKTPGQSKRTPPEPTKSKEIFHHRGHFSLSRTSINARFNFHFLHILPTPSPEPPGHLPPPSSTWANLRPGEKACVWRFFIRLFFRESFLQTTKCTTTRFNSLSPQLNFAAAVDALLIRSLRKRTPVPGGLGRGSPSKWPRGQAVRLPLKWRR